MESRGLMFLKVVGVQPYLAFPCFFATPHFPFFLHFTAFFRLHMTYPLGLLGTPRQQESAVSLKLGR